MKLVDVVTPSLGYAQLATRSTTLSSGTTHRAPWRRRSSASSYQEHPEEVVEGLLQSIPILLETTRREEQALWAARRAGILAVRFQPLVEGR